jgi:hypothetical protein
LTITSTASDAIARVVLAYHPKPKSKAAKKRKRSLVNLSAGKSAEKSKRQRLKT